MSSPRDRRPAPGSRPRRLLAALATAGAAVLLGAAPAGAAAGPAPSLYVANEAAGTVNVVDTATGAVEATLTVGSLPQAVAITPDGATAYVTNQGSGTVSVIDTATNHLGEPITVGPRADSLPTGIAVSPDGSALYVTYGYRPGTEIGPGEVAVISTSTHQVVNRIPVGDQPAGIAISPDGTKAFVADYGSGQITEIEGLGGDSPTAAAPIEVGGTPSGVTITPDGGTVYVSNGNANEISVLDAASGKLTGTLADPSLQAPQGLAASPAGDGAYVADFDGGELTALGAGGQVLGTAGVGGSPFGVAYGPSGETVYASSSAADGGGSVQAIDAASRAAIGEPIHVDDVPLGLAISPDQAPEAELAATARSAGNPTELDASASRVRYGEIVSYAWSFGDGESETTTAPVVEHTYAEPGIYTASVTATDSAGTATTKVFTGQTMSRNGGPSATASRTVTVPAARPLASPSPTALDFGTQTVSQLYVSKPVTLTDSGDAPLQVSSVELAGAGARSFAIDDDHCSGQTLAPGAGCVVEVLFLPTGTGAKAASLRFADDAAGSPQAVALSGVGASPAIAFTPPRLDFPNQAPGTDSAPLALTVTNGGGAPLQVGDVSLAGKDDEEFALLADSCTAAPVEPGQSCAIEVEFRPTTFGARSALVQIEDDAPGSPHVAAVTGAGVGGRAALSPASLSFAEQPVGTRSAAQAVSVANTGNAPLHVTRAVLAGAGAGAFQLGGAGCDGQAVAPGASCTVEVAFAAAAPGDYLAQLSLLDDAAGAPPSVALAGRATADAGGGDGGESPAGGGAAGRGGGGAGPAAGQPPSGRSGGRHARRPRVWSRPARAVKATRARLAGRVDPRGKATRYRFRWGRTRRYGHRTPWRRLGRSARPRAVRVALRGLRPHTAYHFRLLATNEAGTSRGRDRTFRTRGR